MLVFKYDSGCFGLVFGNPWESQFMQNRKSYGTDILADQSGWLVSVGTHCCEWAVLCS